MKKFPVKLVLILVVFFGAVFFQYYVSFAQDADDETIESPLPEFLTKNFPSILGSAYTWRPKMEKAVSAKADLPELTAKASLSYDLTTDSLLYEKNSKMRLPMASLTKIMTAIVAIENFDLSKEITINKKEAEIGENTMGLSEGETAAVEDLLYGLILHSGNDASEALARGSVFGRDNFVYLMNKKAEELGLTDTRFTNPSGLEGDGNQYSTAYDLLVITKYALANPEFAKIVSTPIHEIPYSDKHKAFYLYNETNLLTSYPGVKGVKTGYTYEAGLCLVTYLEYEGHKIIAILLNAQNRREEMKGLLDYSLKSLNKTPPPHS
jgi:D-alanyl-D-alanine carboxypeptidase